MFTCLCRVGNAALMYVCVCMCGHVFMLRYSHSVLFVSSLWSPGILCRFSFSVQVDYPSTSIHPSSVLSHSLFIVIFPESHLLFLRLSCSASLKWIPLLPLIDCLHWLLIYSWLNLLSIFLAVLIWWSWDVVLPVDTLFWARQSGQHGFPQGGPQLSRPAAGLTYGHPACPFCITRPETMQLRQTKRSVCLTILCVGSAARKTHNHSQPLVIHQSTRAMKSL